jgi:hypothetical protein
MPRRRHTITVASSTLFFVCLMLHAQTRPNSLTSTPYNDAEAYKVYETLLPTDWTLRVAHARRLLIEAKTGSTDEIWKALAEHYPNSAHSVLSPVAFSVGHRRGLSFGGDTLPVLEMKDSIWESMRWRGTSRAWAS